MDEDTNLAVWDVIFIPVDQVLARCRNDHSPKRKDCEYEDQ